MLVDVERDERGRVPDRKRVLRVADVVEEPPLVPVVGGPRPAAAAPSRSPSGRPARSSTEPKSRSIRSAISAVRLAAAAAEVLEVDLVVLDPADREGQVDLQRADLGVDLVRGRDRLGQLAEDLVPLVRRSPGRACSAPRPRRARCRRARAGPASARAAVISSLKASSDNVDSFRRAGRRSITARRSAEPVSLSRSRAKGATWPSRFPTLPYDYDALEPHIDEQTMEIHHDKHHQAYVDNANKALEGTEWPTSPSTHVLTNLEILPEDKQMPVRNNAGGHATTRCSGRSWARTAAASRAGALAAAIDDVWAKRRRPEAARQRCRRQALRLGLDLARPRRHGPRRQLDANQDSPLIDRRRPAARHRRLGARLLPELPEPPPGLPRGVVERRQLGRRGRDATSRRSPSGGQGLARRRSGRAAGMTLQTARNSAVL